MENVMPDQVKYYSIIATILLPTGQSNEGVTVVQRAAIVSSAKGLGSIPKAEWMRRFLMNYKGPSYAARYGIFDEPVSQQRNRKMLLEYLQKRCRDIGRREEIPVVNLRLDLYNTECSLQRPQGTAP